MMEAVRTSETSVNFYQTTRRKNPENSRLFTFFSGPPGSSIILTRYNQNPLSGFISGTALKYGTCQIQILF
jgi:hypothetical protein